MLDGKPVRVAAWTSDWDRAEAKAREMECPASLAPKVE
jgi:hypothetical protein